MQEDGMQISSSFLTKKGKTMKRVLSILLIAASVFGIYNYYENIMDVFACKTYWEEKSGEAEDTLHALGAALNKLKRNTKAYNTGKKQMASGKKSLAANEGRYYQAGSQLSSAKKEISEGENTFSDLRDLIKAISTARSDYTKKWKSPFTRIYKERTMVIKSLSAHAPNGYSSRTMLKGFVPYLEDEEEREAYENALTKRLSVKEPQNLTGYKQFASDCHTVADAIDEIEHLLKARGKIEKYSTEQLRSALNDPSQDIYDGAYLMLRLSLYYTKNKARALVDKAADGDKDSLQEIIDCSKDEYTKEKITSRLNIAHWVQDYITSLMKICADDIDANIYNLYNTQNTVATDIRRIANTILRDSTMTKYARKALGSKAITVLEYYSKDPSPLCTNSSSFISFYGQMEKNPGLAVSLEKAQTYLTTQKTDAYKKLYSAKTKYNYKLKTYNSTPAKLETARKKLDTLKKKLVLYESSEKELERGLEELVDTEPQGGLKSVRERVGNIKFKNKYGRLNVNNGQKAVDAGEAYLSEQGDRIKSEITGRIIATVMGIISAVLALLAALLSLFRSNRGAAIIACISAVTAAGAAVFGTSADTVYSEIAGSQIGDTPWTAAAIIAGVALVFSVTHFAAKVEDPLEDEE